MRWRATIKNINVFSATFVRPIVAGQSTCILIDLKFRMNRAFVDEIEGEEKKKKQKALWKLPPVGKFLAAEESGMGFNLRNNHQSLVKYKI